jgi:hypothetical protein
MQCDLERVYGSLAAQLPENADGGERFMLDETVIPSGRTPDASSCYGDDEQMTE